MEEVWRAIPVYNSLWPDGNVRYEVSNIGRVREGGHDTFRGGWRGPKLVKQLMDNCGRHFVRLMQAELTVNALYVHGLVAMAFVENPQGYSQVRHIDGDVENNTVRNVEWVAEGGQEVDFTHSCNDVMANGEYSRNGIRQYSYDGKLIDTYKSSLDVHESLGLRAGFIADYCRRKIVGRLKFGYAWRYVDDDELFELSESERAKVIGTRPIRQYDPKRGLVKEYPAIVVAAESVAVRGGIARCCKRQQITSGGFIWRYADDDEFAKGVDVYEYWKESYANSRLRGSCDE